MNTKLTFLILLVFPTIFACNCPCGKPVCQTENQLLRVDQIQYGAPVRTVSWLCDEITPYAAIGGQPVTTLTSNYDFQIYQLNNTTEKLSLVANGIHGGYVLSSDWCSIGGIAYVAVAGTANDEGYEVEIFSLENGTLTRVAYFTHGANIYSISWLCQCNGSSYLAIGGEPSNQDLADARILLVPTLTTTAQELTAASNIVHGGIVYAVDWCTSLTCPLLAIGGEVSSIECGINIRIFSLACTSGNLFPYAQAKYTSGIVNTLKWCCGQLQNPCFTNPLLAVGGTRTQNTDPNIFVYYLSSRTNELKDYAYTSSNPQPKIYAVAWNPSCKCANITAGGGCLEEPVNGCYPNVFVYHIAVPKMLNLVTQQQFDTNITSLAWCQPTGQLCSYLLVGSEAAAETLENPDINCKNSFEVALYKGLFCRQLPAPVLPVCNRN